VSLAHGLPATASVRADVAARAGAVLHDDGLAERFRQPVAHGAGEDVDQPAGDEGGDDLYGLGRVGRGEERRGRRSEGEQYARCEDARVAVPRLGAQDWTLLPLLYASVTPRTEESVNEAALAKQRNDIRLELIRARGRKDERVPALRPDRP
jgi:hypothetical protein